MAAIGGAERDVLAFSGVNGRVIGVVGTLIGARTTRKRHEDLAVGERPEAVAERPASELAGVGIDGDVLRVHQGHAVYCMKQVEEVGVQRGVVMGVAKGTVGDASAHGAGRVRGRANG